MSGRHKVMRGDQPGLPIGKDTSVQVTTGSDGKPEIESVKPIFRPPELISQPVKHHWAYIWIAVVIVAIAAWAFLFWYFSNHQAPYAAPIK